MLSFFKLVAVAVAGVVVAVVAAEAVVMTARGGGESERRRRRHHRHHSHHHRSHRHNRTPLFASAFVEVCPDLFWTHVLNTAFFLLFGSIP